MFLLVVGAGRVGSSVATSALRAGHTVSVLDEDPLSHERLDVELGTSWEEAGGRFTIGTALELDALIESGIEEADIFIASTNGDNTNLVVAQLAQLRFEVPRVIARILDPRRAAWYAEQGLETICPTQIAIEQLEKAALDLRAPPATPTVPGSAADHRLAASSTLEMPGAFLRACVLASRRQRPPGNGADHARNH